MFIWSFSYPVSFFFLSADFSRASKQTLSAFDRSENWVAHPQSCFDIKRNMSSLSPKVLMEVLVQTKWGARTISVGSCVDICRVKAVQVQCGCPEVSIHPLGVALKGKAFCCGMHLVGLAHLKQLQCHGFKNYILFQVQGRDVLGVVIIKYCHTALHYLAGAAAGLILKLLQSCKLEVFCQSGMWWYLLLMKP